MSVISNLSRKTEANPNWLQRASTKYFNLGISSSKTEKAVLPFNRIQIEHQSQMKNRHLINAQIKTQRSGGPDILQAIKSIGNEKEMLADLYRMRMNETKTTNSA